MSKFLDLCCRIHHKNVEIFEKLRFGPRFLTFFNISSAEKIKNQVSLILPRHDEISSDPATLVSDNLPISPTACRRRLKNNNKHIMPMKK